MAKAQLDALKVPAAILGVLMSALPAYAESDAVCKTYAKSAVDAFTESQRYCGFGNARWQGNYDAHYGWCRNAATAAVNAERSFRANQLRVCKKEGLAVECDKYAILADGDARSNAKCGFTGPRWQYNYDVHLAWCLTNGIAAANSEINIRRALLTVCARDPVGVRCDGYSKEAVSLANEAKTRGCSGIAGGRWTANYEQHLVWCIGAPAQAAAAEASARKGLLSQCRTLTLPGGGAPSVGSCGFSVTITNKECLNPDGSPPQAAPGSQTSTECGATKEQASLRAKQAFQRVFGRCLVDGDDPPPGCCTYDENP